MQFNIIKTLLITKIINQKTLSLYKIYKTKTYYLKAKIKKTKFFIRSIK